MESLDVARLSPNLAGEMQATLQLQGSGFTEAATPRHRQSGGG